RLPRQSGRDVVVPVELPAADQARVRGVYADPQAGTPAGDIDRVEFGRPRDDRVEGELRRGGDRTESVPETLDHVPAVPGDLVLSVAAPGTLQEGVPQLQPAQRHLA